MECYLCINNDDIKDVLLFNGTDAQVIERYGDTRFIFYINQTDLTVEMYNPLDGKFKEVVNVYPD